jgi:hypothetical protein
MQEVVPYFGFYCIFINKFFNLHGAPMLYPPGAYIFQQFTNESRKQIKPKLYNLYMTFSGKSHLVKKCLPEKLLRFIFMTA